jgi:hypothetical protein
MVAMQELMLSMRRLIHQLPFFLKCVIHILLGMLGYGALSYIPINSLM